MATTLHAPPAVTEAAIDGSEIRGIYRYEYKVEGCPAYFALTQRGELTGRGLRVVWPGDSIAMVVSDLSRELRECDPVRPTYLKLHVDSAPRPLESLSLTEALDLDGPEFARWLFQ